MRQPPNHSRAREASGVVARVTPLAPSTVSTRNTSTRNTSTRITSTRITYSTREL